MKNAIKFEDKTCKKCKDKGVIEYYYDAGDHFGGNPPGSGWRVKPCDCKKSQEKERKY